MNEYIERVVDLTDPNQTELLNLTPDEARQRMLDGSPEPLREFDGAVAPEGQEAFVVGHVVL